MDIFETELSLIPKVYAQGVDGVAQPTFGILDIGNQGTSQASVTLTTDSTAVKVGGIFEVTAEIKTGSFTINEYRLILEFNPALLSVIDADTTKTGTQIEFLDTVFEVDGDNNSVSSGKITLIAKTPSGSALQVNRQVARIKFQAQAAGNALIDPVQGVDGTQLINQNGVAIASSLDSLTVAISTSTTPPPPPEEEPGENGNGGTDGGSGTPLPATGLADDVFSILPAFIGILLIALGVSLRRGKKSTK